MRSCLILWIKSLFSSQRKQQKVLRSTTADLSQVRQALQACLDDCPPDEVHHLQRRIHAARCHRTLWQLRTEVYRCVALAHCQTLAAERVKALVHHFEGWVDPTELQYSMR